MAIISRYVRQANGVYEEDFCLREVPIVCAEEDTDPELIMVELDCAPPPLPEHTA